MQYLQGWTAVYYREMLILKRKLIKLLASMAVAPLLYLVTFRYATGDSMIVQGHPYLEFLIPGLVAMSSMRQAFAVSSEINVARFYWHIFEEFQAAPLHNIAYVTGEVLAGITRALLAAVIILSFGWLFGVKLSYHLAFWLAVFLNGFVFASLAIVLAMLVRSHADQALLTNFVITPMAFLSGTFFPLERLPSWGQFLLNLLPLPHASRAIRAASYGEAPDYLSYLLLTVVGGVFFLLAFRCVNSARD